VAAVEERRSGALVRGLAEPGLLPALRGRLGARVRTGATDPDGLVEVEVSGPTVPFLVAELAGLGRRLRLVDPPEARAGLRALAEELRELYAEDVVTGDLTGPASPAAGSAAAPPATAGSR
jgi:hypothetical protein